MKTMLMILLVLAFAGCATTGPSRAELERAQQATCQPYAGDARDYRDCMAALPPKADGTGRSTVRPSAASPLTAVTLADHP